MTSYKNFSYLIGMLALLATAYQSMACKACDTLIHDITAAFKTSRITLNESHNPVYEQLFKENSMLSIVFDMMNKHPLASVCVGTVIAFAGYLSYIIYLDYAINRKECLWRLIHQPMDEDMIDRVHLIEELTNRYQARGTIHPLATLFAALHEIEQELSYCLSLRSARALSLVAAVITEQGITIDKKIEYLYRLKSTLLSLATETRRRCKSALNANT